MIFLFTFCKRSVGSPELNCARTPSFQIDWGPCWPTYLCTWQIPALCCAFHASGLSHFIISCRLIQAVRFFSQYQDHIRLQNQTVFSDGVVKTKHRWIYQTASLPEPPYPIKGKDLCSCSNLHLMVIINISSSCYIFNFYFTE